MGNYTQIESEFNNRLAPKINEYYLNLQQKDMPIDQNQLQKIIYTELLFFRKDKMEDLYKYTNRNVICYYSTWLQGNTANPNPEVMINDNDINGFMNAVSQLDKNKGLDLILHTPGGVVTATESIVSYLRKVFNGDIRVIVPHLAMSAGTMIACSSREIIMGKESSLGPVDPQYRNVPAQGVLKEFEEAMKQTTSSPNRSLIWKEIIGQYRPTFLGECENVVKLSKDLVREWLETCMFKKSKNKDKKIKKIIDELASHDASKVHDRHYDYIKCKNLGLKVKMLESDSILQDKVLSIYHSYVLSTYTLSNSIKFIEAHNGNTLTIRGNR